MEQFKLKFKKNSVYFDTLKAAKDYAVRNWPATENMIIFSKTPGIGYQVKTSNGKIIFPRVETQETLAGLF